MTTTNMIPASGVPESFDGPFSGIVNVNADGLSITIDSRDIQAAMNGGFLPSSTRVRNYQTTVAPAAASSSLVVASTTTANGSLTIAAQPAQSRQLQFVSAPGSPGITAGVLTVGPYTANDGTTQSDVFSLVGAATATFVTSKGVLHISGTSVAGLVGGTSPTIVGGTNGTLSVPMTPHSVSATILKEDLDGADVGSNVGTLSNTGLYTPHTAPNGTHLFGIDYTSLSF